MNARLLKYLKEDEIRALNLGGSDVEDVLTRLAITRHSAYLVINLVLRKHKRGEIKCPWCGSGVRWGHNTGCRGQKWLDDQKG